ncbi:MAG: Hint domain-containing protein [Sediminimonas sp.]|uniref:Hint domain-containing protein n=1 Tax=Sediminimonas sp. TaxID=2823379 RepID=UPI00286FDEE5|nr:Hint domain-containing protein [Sediminimonas sp.]MDR9484875.1 Hint domain-containing protein [Sediminimonas sp.]
MSTCYGGTFVISWAQTEVDGLRAAPVRSLSTGMPWTWHGEAVRVDGPQEILRLEQADGEANLRKRAARTVRRLVGAAATGRRDIEAIDPDTPLMDSSIILTDGTKTFTVTVIEPGTGAAPLLMFLGEVPPQNRELWVVHHTMEPQRANPLAAGGGGVICFTPGTRILTPVGQRPVEALRVGDRVQTKDDGAQEILWIGRRRMSGARLYAMPELRPVRIRMGALGVERPDEELLVSPAHRMLVAGHMARELFNTPEVLVAARDLINGRTVTVDMALREVDYIHILLSRHQVLWANGVETESFHPANAALSTLDATGRDSLLAKFPGLEFDPHSYGDYARRNLSQSEAAILMHEAA